MENALKIVAEIISKLPQDHLSPETTEGKEGFVHPVAMSGIAERAEVQFIIRDFDTSKLDEHVEVIRQTANEVMAKYSGSKATLTKCRAVL